MKNKKHYNFLSSVFIGFFLLAIFVSAGINNPAIPPKYVSVEKYVRNGAVQSKITGKGGHQEECIDMEFKNLTPDTLFMLLEPGRVLVAEDSSYQNIFIVKTKKIEVPPLATRSVSAYGFCCESHDMSPREGLKFKIGYMAPPDWQKLATVIDKNNFPPSAVQSAVWVLSNGHELSSVYDSDMASIYELRKALADIKGQEVPWYSIIYKTDTATLFSNVPEKVTGDIDYYLRNNSIITINIRNKNGVVLSTPIRNMPANPGQYTYTLDLNVAGWKKGDYDVLIYTDLSTIHTRKTFKLQ